MKNGKLKRWLTLFKMNLKQTNVSDSAVVLAYYVLLSLFPLLIILGSLLRIIDVKYGHLISSLYLILPTKIYAVLKPVIYSALTDGGKEQLSIGLLVTVWSASRMIAAFQRTVNLAYGIPKPGTISNRLISFFWMICFVFFIVGLTFFMVFGQMAIKFMIHYFHWPSLLLKLINVVRLPVTLVALSGVIGSLYYFVPLVKTRLKWIWQGTITATLGLLVLSKFFSIYLKFFAKSFSAYQALGTFIILMFWLYFLGIVLLFGAVINATNQKYAMRTLNLKHVPGIKSK